jgi:hypothetical protein
MAHATEEFFPDSSLYEVLQQKIVNILVASDGSHMGLRGICARPPNTVLPSLRVRPHLPSLVLDSLHSFLQYRRLTCVSPLTATFLAS